jgi:hypothetical protein
MILSWYRQKAADCARNAVEAGIGARRLSLESDAVCWLQLAERSEEVEAPIIAKPK